MSTTQLQIKKKEPKHQSFKIHSSMSQKRRELDGREGMDGGGEGEGGEMCYM